jgi:hypothetical protein
VTSFRCSFFLCSDLWPLRKIIYSDQEVSVSLVVPGERPCYIDGYPFEHDPNIVLVHLALIPHPWVVTGCTVGTISQYHFLPEPVVSLTDLIQGFVDTQVTS